jgi:predicted GNAT family acetyltransferase
MARRAFDADRPLLVEWLHGFHADTGQPLLDPEGVVATRVAAGHWWLWEDDAPVSMAALSEPVAGVARVQAVYTPPEHRSHGYASAAVAHLSTMTLGLGRRCILYTDLGNPTSNAIYRRLGYRAVAEVLRYEFE